MSFKDIKGQASALEIIEGNISSGRTFSSYLFVGPGGVGKRLAAKNFAKAVNCLDTGADPCDECVSCRKIDMEAHPDVALVEPKGAASAIGIGEIRSIITKANFKPYAGRKKVFIIDDAQLLTSEASNAFLKTLEEPPRNTIFILIATSKELLIATIVSRCHMVRFHTASPELVSALMSEKFKLTKKESQVLGGFSNGRIGEAVRMMETDFIGRKNRAIDSLFCAGTPPGEESDIYGDKETLKDNIDFLISYLRDIFLYKAVPDGGSIFNIDRRDEIREQAHVYSEEFLENSIKRAIDLRSCIDKNVNPKIVADVLIGEMRKFEE
ncbi:MAG: DNA polymerase III subunit [Candidatus Omnitrophota bacterium]